MPGRLPGPRAPSFVRKASVTEGLRGPFEAFSRENPQRNVSIPGPGTAFPPFTAGGAGASRPATTGGGAAPLQGPRLAHTVSRRVHWCVVCDEPRTLCAGTSSPTTRLTVRALPWNAGRPGAEETASPPLASLRASSPSLRIRRGLSCAARPSREDASRRGPALLRHGHGTEGGRAGPPAHPAHFPFPGSRSLREAVFPHLPGVMRSLLPAFSR